MEVMRSAAEQEKMGREVLHLEVGQPQHPRLSGLGDERQMLLKMKFSATRLLWV